MATSHSGRIVVGTDGSDSALRAALWAAETARCHGAVLRLVHGYAMPERGYPRFLVPTRALRTGLRAQARSALHTTSEAVRGGVPGTELETRIVEAAPAVALLRESRGALMNVVGSRGLGGFSGLLIGSVAMALVAHSRVPTVVVRDELPDSSARHSLPVLVAVDGSPASSRAVAFAFREAATRGVSLTAVHVAQGHRSSESVLDSERALLSERLAGWSEHHPDVPVERLVLPGHVVRTLLEVAAEGQLLVVGSRGTEGFPGMLLGSTSRSLVVHAPRSLAVVRPEDEPHGERFG
ncbi:universal stress protein [Actinopolyspora xinjiangensis]|uniref:universal stress protein n=1 Tax=Actinopolyspora xinjiangensis TaxID=405564 RepID=UPI000B83E909|nr:universal stress protein [Actinopolyspora xinjiangensis]